MVAGEATLAQLTPEVYRRMNSLGDTLREKLGAVFAELEVEARVTGIGSLFGTHFTSKEVTDYRSFVRSDQKMRRGLFTGLLNEGVLLQAKSFGALSALTTEAEIDTLVDATRRVVQRIK